MIEIDPNIVPQTKASTGVGTSSQSSKMLHPSSTSIKTSPKASLAEVKGMQANKLIIPDNKIKQIEIAEKNKEEIKRSLANVIKVYYPQKTNCLDVSLTEITKDATQKDEGKVARNDFLFLEVIGEGGYGKVWKV